MDKVAKIDTGLVFHVSKYEAFRVLLVEKSVGTDGGLCNGRALFDDRLIEIAADVPPAQRKALLRHEGLPRKRRLRIGLLIIFGYPC